MIERVESATYVRHPAPVVTCVLVAFTPLAELTCLLQEMKRTHEKPILLTRSSLMHCCIYPLVCAVY